MKHTVLKRPPDLLRFVSIEHEQFLISLANNKDEIRVLSHVHGLYDAATSEKSVGEDDMAVFQLLSFTHYHFLFSTACLMRCHLSEAFASARAAIDGALVGAQIIYNRASQVAYTKREKPFDNFARYLGNLIKDKKPCPIASCQIYSAVISRSAALQLTPTWEALCIVCNSRKILPTP